MSDSQALVQVENVTYDYPGNRALQDVSISFDRGVITAIVGPNGAGKSTLMRCIAALDHPFSGRIIVDGHDSRRSPRKIHKILGYLPDFFGLYEELSVQQSLQFSARAHGLKRHEIGEAVKEAAEQVQLEDRLQHKARELSRGLRQRLAIGQAIVHKPKLLILDEPASGLDPQARNSLAQLFLALAGQGMTLLVSSHILAELDAYSDRMVIIEQGQILGGEAAHKASRATEIIAVDLSIDENLDEDELRRLIDPIENVELVEIEKQRLILQLSEKGEQRRAALLSALIQAGLRVTGFTRMEENLESLYRKEMGRKS